jgi:alkyl hydroperoxide reductase subunit AhpF
VLLAMKCAFASPRVTATAIEANEFPRLAEEMEVWAVPRIVVNGSPQWDGAVPEPVFLQRILSAAYG